MTAIEDGDYYVLNGTKVWVTNCATASWFFVLARTSTTESTGNSFTAFIVDKDLNGLQIGDRLTTMGLKCADVRTLTFDNVRVPKDNIVGAVGKGFSVAMKTFDRVRPLVASLGKLNRFTITYWLSV
jgi:acyl-CoA dehydrogenase